MAEAFHAELLLFAVTPTFATLKPERSGPARLLPSTTTALLDLEADHLRDGLEQLADAAGTRGVRCRTVMKSGDAASVLLLAIEQEQPDLVVFASHGRKGLDTYLTESVGARLCHRSPVPLLVQPI
jgi:nucleotide-binding universal stress UspA family protein